MSYTPPADGQTIWTKFQNVDEGVFKGFKDVTKVFSTLLGGVTTGIKVGQSQETNCKNLGFKTQTGQIVGSRRSPQTNEIRREVAVVTL